jgi:hypothetical protein
VSEKLVECPDCASRVRPCNLARHRRTHAPIPEYRRYSSGAYTYFEEPKRPLLQYRTHDRRYDEWFPRGLGHYRFRIYRLRGGELQLIAAAGTPEYFGVALYDLHRRGEFIPDDATGVLDTLTEPGMWVVHPFALGRTRQREAA